MEKINIQPGHIARHTPKGASAQGKEAAVIDIAQDLLLAHLSDEGSLDDVSIKGGTALRKLYAGKEGRFSLDLDFAVANINTEIRDIALRFINSVDGLKIGPFTYGVKERRGRWSITLSSPFVDGSTLATKLDFAPTSWLDPVKRNWIPMPIHKQYGFDLPSINTVSLEENISEKIARLNRTTTARDMYDLAWLASTPSVAKVLNRDLIRRLAVLKIWVDTNGLRSVDMQWGPAHSGSKFDPKSWLRPRDESEFDLEDIGALAVPAPTAKELSEVVSREYAFLLDLSEEEQVLSNSNERDRSLALKMFSELPGSRLASLSIY